MEKSKRSISATKNIFKLTPEQRSERARKMVKARFAKMTKEQRSEHARKLVQARWAKKKLKK